MRLLTRHFKPAGRAVLASLLMGLVLLLNAMAASPSLHELLHKDAKTPDHQCVVTVFAHGKLDSAAATASVSAPQIFTVAVSSLDILVFSPAIEGLPAGRAPPVSSSNS